MRSIKKCVVPILALIISANLAAQDYLTGKLVDPAHGERRILYDRTQYAMGLSVYKTVYKVMDPNKTTLYNITLTHDGLKGVIYLTVKEGNAAAKAKTIAYNKKSSGLIFRNGVCGHDF